MTEHTEGRFTGAARGTIYWQGWAPEGDVKGVLVLSHGYAEHGGRYAHVAERLAADGFATYAPDHRGHGRSEGPRANVNRMAEVVTDLDAMIDVATGEHPGVPLFLYGHSMGGLIALRYAIAHQSKLSGLLLSGPAVVTSVGSKFERSAAKLLSRITPNLRPTPLDSSLICRDPEVVRKYDTDPLVYRGKIPVRTGAESLITADAVITDLAKLRLPLLIVQGTEDKLVSPTGAQLVAGSASSEDITLKLYEGLYHEVHNEPEHEAVLDDIAAWLAKHV